MQLVRADDNSGLGIVLDHKGSVPEHQIWVDEVIPGSVADKTGQIHAGDQLMSINGVEVCSMAMERVISKEMLGQQVVSLTVRHLKGAMEALQELRANEGPKDTLEARSLAQMAEAVNDLNVESDLTDGGKKGKRRGSITLSPQKRQEMRGTESGDDGGGTVFDVELQRDVTGLGLVLDQSDERVHPAEHRIWVDQLILGTPADVCGKIQVGDILEKIGGVRIVAGVGQNGLAVSQMLAVPRAVLTLRRPDDGAAATGAGAGTGGRISRDDASLSNEVWCGPIFARVVGGMVRRVSQEWVQHTFACAGDSFCLYNSRMGQEPVVSIQFTHQHHITEPKSQAYSSTGLLDVFTINKRSGAVDKAIVKIGSTEPGIIGRLAQHIEKVVAQKMRSRPRKVSTHHL